jgi:4-oxalocrotonate tautomerase
MPFVHIFHSWESDDPRTTWLVDGVHQALVETFAVPVDDHFQPMSSHTSGRQLRVAPEFLGVRHSPDADLIQVTCTPGQSAAQKKALSAAIASKAHLLASTDPQEVIVNLVETSRENWSFGNGPTQFSP